jgi:hypothetical protein
MFVSFLASKSDIFFKKKKMRKGRGLKSIRKVFNLKDLIVLYFI